MKKYRKMIRANKNDRTDGVKVEHDKEEEKEWHHKRIQKKL